MALTLMYITNNPSIAQIAQNAGVDRIWVDMEYIGKEERQKGMNSVKSHHTVADIEIIRNVICSSQLMVRVNPIHESTVQYCDSKEEIENTIHAGADVIMLPMFKTPEEVSKFVEYVNGRATVQILVETREAVERIDEIINIQGVDEVHIGLNDLHLSYGQKFMFQPLCDGIVDGLVKRLKEKGLKYGFGGIARLGKGLLPAELVIAEHYRLGSTAAILSRSFCDANNVDNPESIHEMFCSEVRRIREWEDSVASFSPIQFEENHARVERIVKEIISKQC